MRARWLTTTVCKRLAETYPRSFASWLLGQPVGAVEVLKTELSREPLRADALILLRLAGLLLHIEFQTTPRSKPPLPLRMLDYWVQGYRRHELPIEQFVIVLSETDAEIPTEFRAPNTWHRYNVIKLWEQDAEIFLTSPGLLPLAALTRAAQPRDLSRQVVEQTMPFPSDTERADLLSCAAILAGLRFDKELISQYFPEAIMQESVVYQEIIQRGVQQGIELGKQEGKLETALRLLTHRFGALDPHVGALIEKLDAAKLDDLSEALLDFQRAANLEEWLAQHV